MQEKSRCRPIATPEEVVAAMTLGEVAELLQELGLPSSKADAAFFAATVRSSGNLEDAFRRIDPAVQRRAA